MKKYLFGAAALVVLFLSSCTTLSEFWTYGPPDVYDYRIFQSDYIQPSSTPFHFAQINNVSLPTADLWACDKKVSAGCSPEEFIKNTNTLALIVIRRDTIIYEDYAHGHSRESLSQVFSVTKSFMATLVGIAIDEGYIKDVDQPVSDFLPQFGVGEKQKITLSHLLNMTSGLNFGDFENIFKLLTLYYSHDQSSMLHSLKVIHEPGSHFAYSSMSTYILGLCLEKATGVPAAQYLQEKIWQPLGMEYSARLAKDAVSGKAKFYGGLAARALDLAKLGRLYMNNGMWNGKQIVSKEWVMTSRQREKESGSENYTKSWWLDTFNPSYDDGERNDFFAGGFRGQLIYVNPTDSIIIIRLGISEKGVRWGETLSKLAMLPMEPVNFVKEGLALNTLNGKYRNHKLNKQLEITMNGPDVLVQGFQKGAVLKLKKAGRFEFKDDSGKYRVLLSYKNHRVSGVLLEGGDSPVFFEKVL